MFSSSVRTILVLTVSCLLTTFAFGADEEKPPQYESEGIAIPPASAEEEIREHFSLEKAAGYLDQGATAWTKSHSCVSCHTNGSYMVMRPALSGVLGKPNEEMREFFVAELEEYKQLPEERLYAGANPAAVVYIAAGLAEWDKHVTGKLTPETEEAFRFMFQIQAENGTWSSATCWPPLNRAPTRSPRLLPSGGNGPVGWKQHRPIRS
ncbi:MAG: hypothetical protein R3C11_10120 [Planctomycetaceae bacterium]